MAKHHSACATILVIEDDDAIREAIQYALEAEGYKVRTARDGKEGLESLHNVGRPCLILLDLMLPIMNGWEFLDEIKRDAGNMLAAIPVVITSAAGPAAHSAVRLANGFIKKPIDLTLLLNAVAKYCQLESKEKERSKSA